MALTAPSTVMRKLSSQLRPWLGQMAVCMCVGAGGRGQGAGAGAGMLLGKTGENQSPAPDGLAFLNWSSLAQ